MCWGSFLQETGKKVRLRNSQLMLSSEVEGERAKVEQDLKEGTLRKNESIFLCQGGPSYSCKLYTCHGSNH